MFMALSRTFRTVQRRKPVELFEDQLRDNGTIVIVIDKIAKLWQIQKYEESRTPMASQIKKEIEYHQEQQKRCA